jgi:hypothetical protein
MTRRKFIWVDQKNADYLIGLWKGDHEVGSEIADYEQPLVEREDD